MARRTDGQVVRTIHPRGNGKSSQEGWGGWCPNVQEADRSAAAQGIPGSSLRPAQQEPAVSGRQTSPRWVCCILMGFYQVLAIPQLTSLAAACRREA